MGLTDRLRSVFSERAEPQISLQQYIGMLNYGGNVYPMAGLNQSLPGQKQEDIEHSYEGYVTQALRSNSVIFACFLVRMQLFSEARFQFQQMRGGRPGDLFGSADLDILEHPWPGGTTGDLLSRALLHADFGGNAFIVRSGSGLRLSRPDWWSIVLGSENDPQVSSIDIDATVLGYIYHPGGPRSQEKAVPFLREEVAHFAPIPDPLARYRGMSWLTPLVREIQADSAATSHKLRFFENGATPNLVVKTAPGLTPDKFAEWVRLFKEKEPAGYQAYKTLYLDGASDATVIGANLRQMDFKVTQGAGETRIAAAAGVPPVIVGLSEGLQAATYSNYSQARRRFADGTMRPLWRNMAGSLETIIPARKGSRLWYDDRDIQFLAEDQKDLAEVQQFQAASIRSLIDGGFKADAVVEAVMANDLSRLTGAHTGLFSVQLQAPGSTKMPAGEVPGETPVGPGSKPETIPPGDTSTKPLASGSSKNGTPAAPKRALLAPLLKE
jgi:phage portal protein BeeE